jgi:hypothetical protein
MRDRRRRTCDENAGDTACVAPVERGSVDYLWTSVFKACSTNLRTASTGCA